jgi:hypothetical protein
MAAFAEGMVLGQALGLEQETLLNVLVGGPVTPPYMGWQRPFSQKPGIDSLGIFRIAYFVTRSGYAILGLSAKCALYEIRNINF